MKRNAIAASVLVLVMVPWHLQAQVQWTDKEGKTHVTDKLPKEHEVSAQEWARLQAEAEKAKALEAADQAETLPDVAAGKVLAWTGKDGVQHHTNVAPKKSEVSDSEWERLKAAIPKLNESAPEASSEVPQPAEKPPAAAAEAGEALPSLPEGKTIMWTGKNGASHMTSTPPSRGEVTSQEWERLKVAINDIIEDAKAEPPAPAVEEKEEEKTEAEPASQPVESEGGSASLGPAGLLDVTCDGDMPEMGKYEVSGKIRNRSSDQVARDVKIKVDLFSDHRPVQIDDYDPLTVAAIYPGDFREYHLSFELSEQYRNDSLSCKATVVSAQVQAQ